MYTLEGPHNCLKIIENLILLVSSTVLVLNLLQDVVLPLPNHTVLHFPLQKIQTHLQATLLLPILSQHTTYHQVLCSAHTKSQLSNLSDHIEIN